MRALKPLFSRWLNDLERRLKLAFSRCQSKTVRSVVNLEPAFTSISEEALEEELRYNAMFQVNDESRLALTLGGSTSTSIIRGCTTTGEFPVRDDDDSMGDESQ